MAESANTTSEQSNIVRLVPRDHARTYRTEFVLFEGHKRRQWTVVEREADGTETHIVVSRGRRREAVYMANLFTRCEADNAKQRANLARHPLGALLLSMNADDRKMISNVLASMERWEGGRAC